MKKPDTMSPLTKTAQYKSSIGSWLKRGATAGEDQSDEDRDLFSLISENVTDLIAVVRIDGKCLSINASYKQVLENWKEHQETDFFQEVHPDDREAIKKLFAHVVATGVSQYAEHRFLLTDGTVRFIESNFNLLRGIDGNPSKVLIVSRDATERKVEHGMLVRLASFPEQNPEPIFEMSLDGALTYLNVATVRYFPDLHALGVRHPILSDWESIRSTFQEQGKGSIVRELTVGDKSYEQQVYYVPQSKLVRVYTLDITERIRAQEGLRKSENRFRALVENSSDAIALLASDGTMLYAGPSIERILGYRDAEAIGMNVLDLIHADDRDAVADAVVELRKQPRSARTIEYRMRHKNGASEWIEGTMTNLLVEPSVQAIVLNYHVITERKKAQDEIRSLYRVLEQRVIDRTHQLAAANRELEAEIIKRKWAEEETSQLASIVQSSDDAIIGMTLDGTIVSWNRGAEKVYQYEPNEIRGQSVAILNAPEQSDGVAKILEIIKQGGQLEHYEGKHVRKDGRKIDASLTISPIKDATGKITGVSTIARDITEKIRMEKERIALREKEVLLKEIHHRVKNNLQVISSLLSLQTKYIKDKSALEVFKESQNRIKSMSLIHEQLYQSRELARIDFAEYARSLMAHLFRSFGIGAHAIALKMNVGHILLGIDTAIPCGLILHELVSNSLKHAFPDLEKSDARSKSTRERTKPRGEIRIALRSVSSPEAETSGGVGRISRMFTLSVSDNGIGLPKRFDIKEAESFGLRLVGTLSRQLGATITIESGGGTEFRFAFPELTYRERG
jgi:PAS domain S-box-containing protein